MPSSGRRQSSSPGGELQNGGLSTTVQGVEPSEELLSSFWHRIAQLTTRTKVDQEWVGSQELVRWNENNSQVSAHIQVRSLKLILWTAVSTMHTQQAPSTLCRGFRSAKLQALSQLKGHLREKEDFSIRLHEGSIFPHLRAVLRRLRQATERSTERSQANRIRQTEESNERSRISESS